MAKCITTGRVAEIKPEVENKGYVSQTIYLDEDNDHGYSNHIDLQVEQSKFYMIKNLRQGDRIEATFFVRGRIYTDQNTGMTKLFTNNVCTEVKVLSAYPAEDNDSEAPPL